MKFFIDEPKTYLSVNNKGRAMNKWISTFTHVLIPDELSRDAFIELSVPKRPCWTKNFQEPNRFVWMFPETMIYVLRSIPIRIRIILSS